jgi:hypothetical protein
MAFNGMFFPDQYTFGCFDKLFNAMCQLRMSKRKKSSKRTAAKRRKTVAIVFDLSAALKHPKQSTQSALREILSYAKNDAVLISYVTRDAETIVLSFRISRSELTFFDECEFAYRPDDKACVLKLKVYIPVEKDPDTGLYREIATACGDASIDLLRTKQFAGFENSSPASLGYRHLPEDREISTFTTAMTCDLNTKAKAADVLISFAMDLFRYLAAKHVQLSDESVVGCSINNTIVSLFWLRTMCDGQGWYSKWGFQVLPEYRTAIDEIRNLRVSDLLGHQILWDQGSGSQSLLKVPDEFKDATISSLWCWMSKNRCDLLPVIEYVVLWRNRFTLQKLGLYYPDRGIPHEQHLS